MTPQQFVAVLWRRRLVLLLGLVLTVVVAVLLPRDPGVFYSRVDVIFLVPQPPHRAGNPLQGEDESLINFTAAVQRQVNGSARPLPISSEEATLYGTGVRHGFAITLPSPGGQWQSGSFDSATLRVEVVDTTEAQTTATMTSLLDRIQTAATADQDAVAVPASKRIRTEVNPAQPVVAFVPGSWKRAVAVTLLTGSGLAVAAAVLTDRVRPARRPRTRARSRSGRPAALPQT